jgi:hypothetical protein
MGEKMFAIAAQTMSRLAVMTLTIVAVVGVTLSTPASATNGRTAVRMCIDSTASGARCGWAVSDDGSIDICNKNGCITCPSADGECTVAKVSHRPQGRGLPVGTEVKTKIGTFTVGAPSKKEGIDSLIRQLTKSAPDNKPAR